MKITLKKPVLDELQDFRDQLAAELEKLTAASSGLANLTQRRAALQEEITDLESKDASSETAAIKLATKRVQLEQVEKKIAALENVPVPDLQANHDRRSELLRRFARFAAKATEPTVTAYCQVIADKIRPWCQDDTTALRLTWNVPAASLLMGTYATPFGTHNNNAGELRRAIARADEILSGELKFTFDAKL